MASDNSETEKLRKEFETYKREVEKAFVNLTKRIETLERRDQFKGR